MRQDYGEVGFELRGMERPEERWPRRELPPGVPLKLKGHEGSDPPLSVGELPLPRPERVT